MVKMLTSVNFEDAIREGTALVDFFADWCGPCKMLSPIIGEIAEERSDVLVGKVNVDVSHELAAKYGIVSIPTLIVFNNGKEVERLIGFYPKDEILAVLECVG